MLQCVQFYFLKVRRHSLAQVEKTLIVSVNLVNSLSAWFLCSSRIKNLLEEFVELFVSIGIFIFPLLHHYIDQNDQN